MPSSSSSHRDTLDRLAEELAERCRRGEAPSVDEYLARYPHLAERIRRLFAALHDRTRPGPSDATRLPGQADPGLPPPERLGEFRILREVGRGGMGVVYEAIQESVGRRVALKVLSGHRLAGPTQVERFRREVRAAGRLHHTNIVPVHDTGEQGGLHYYAMQFIDGHGLDRVLDELRANAEGRRTNDERMTNTQYPMTKGQAPVADTPGSPLVIGHSSLDILSSFGLRDSSFAKAVARLGVQVAEALAHAHRQGILHRDIKPSNLLLDLEGTIWVTDFGLAKAEGDELTNTGDIVGTLRYMAPERFEGRSLPQSDVYSLGLTLYELLTLRPAFDDTQRAPLIERVLFEAPTPPRQIERDIPRDLETIVLKCLAKDPAERYAGADRLADDLRLFLADRPVLARRAGAAERLWRWCRRNPVIASLSAAVVLLLAAVAVVASVSALHLREQRNTVQGQKDELESVNQELVLLRQGEKTAKENALARLAEARLAQARANRWSGQAGRRFVSLEALQEAAAAGGPGVSVGEHRNEALACLALLDVRPGADWQRELPIRNGVAFSPDLAVHAVREKDESVVVYRTDSGARLARLPGAGSPVYGLEFSPDGQLLFVREEGRPPAGRAWTHRSRVWDWRRDRVVYSLAGPQVVAYAFSPDSSKLATSRGDSKVHIRDLRAGGDRVLAVALDPHAIAWSPDGQLLALGDPERNLTFLRLATAVVRPHVVPTRLVALAFTPDSRHVAGAGADWKTYVFEATGGRQAAVLEGHQAEVTRVAFDDRGEVLFSSGWDGTTRLWDWRGGRPLVSVPGVFHRADPDLGRLALAHNFRASIHEVARGDEARLLRGHQRYKGPWGVAVHPAGRVAASAGRDAVRLWDLDTGRPLPALPVAAISVLFTGDGRSLVSSGASGLCVWSLQGDGRSGTLRLGRMHRLTAENPGIERIALAPDGKTIAAAHNRLGQVHLLGLDGGEAVRVLGPMPDVAMVAFSPDGRHVAASGWPTPHVRAWEVATGKVVLDAALSTYATIAFHPHSHWLAVCTSEGGHLWDTRTWKRGRELPLFRGSPDVQAPAYSPDGKLLAVTRPGGVLHLLDADSLAERAVLEAPDRYPPAAVAFSPDGSRLLAAATTRVVRVWDLAVLRRQLGALRLDWSPPAAAPDRRAAPLVVELTPEPVPVPEPPELMLCRLTRALADNPLDAVAYSRRGRLLDEHFKDPAAARRDLDAALALSPDDGPARIHRGLLLQRLGESAAALPDLTRALGAGRPSDADRLRVLLARAEAYVVLRTYDRAQADYRQAALLRPGDPAVCAGQARLYLLGPSTVRNTSRAATLVDVVVRERPDDPATRFTLAVLRYRQGKFAEARKVLEGCLGKEDGRRDGSLLFLWALCHHRESDAAAARTRYNEALKWCRENPPPRGRDGEELSRLRSEAAPILRTPRPPR